MSLEQQACVKHGSAVYFLIGNNRFMRRFTATLYCNPALQPLLPLPQINDRYEFYEELDLDREDRRYFSDKVC
jgi:hypothetical protein